MTARTGDSDPETMLAELALSRELTLQWAVLSSLGFLVALGLFGELYGVFTGAEAAYAIEGVGVSWWNLALDLLVFVALTMGIVAPHELVHRLAIRAFGGRPRYGVGLAHLLYAFARAFRRQRRVRAREEEPGRRNDRA